MDKAFEFGGVSTAVFGGEGTGEGFGTVFGVWWERGGGLLEGGCCGGG